MSVQIACLQTLGLLTAQPRANFLGAFELPHACARCRRWQHTRRRAAQASTRQSYIRHSDTYVIVDPNPGVVIVPPKQQQLFGPLPLRAWIAVAAFVLGTAWAVQCILASDEQPQEQQQESPSESGAHLSDALDSKAYELALARTRQAVAVHKAVQFRGEGNPARAMVELRRALSENAIVREPLLNARYDQADLRELYRMHLRNAEVPYKFATLLQLREMLDIGAQEGEAIEQQLLQSGSSFSI